MSLRLTLIGAGPKSLAVLVKATVLRELGLDVPELHLIEKTEVGAHWNGRHGFTDGRQSLGTSPEKDLGFPYSTRVWGKRLGARIDEAMLRYSWVSYLTAQGLYSDWVDRGRPAPEHRQWAQYLAWTLERVRSTVEVHHGCVEGLQRQGARWKVSYRAGGNLHDHLTDGVMLTGPGQILTPSELPAHPDILTVEGFWERAGEILEEARHLAIVGSGETAAAVALAAAQKAEQVTIVSPTGVTYSRGESFRENRLYTDPDGANWTMLTSAHRRDFIRRTDRGVFSQHAMRYLDRADNLELIAGRLVSIRAENGHLELDLTYDEAGHTLTCDRAVLALGTDPLAPLRAWLDEPSRAWLCEQAGLQEVNLEQVEGAIGYDLSLRNVEPRLHLPMCAGLAQGPGFPNLSCLGRVSDRVLSAYVPVDEP